MKFPTRLCHGVMMAGLLILAGVLGSPFNYYFRPVPPR